MKELIRRIDAEYGFHLTEDEVARIAKESKDADSLLQEINSVDVSGITPLLKLALKRS
jgi:hypothetical protein